MSGGGGGISRGGETQDTASVYAPLTPINTESAMRTPPSETVPVAATRDTAGYYIPPSAIYSSMFGQNPGYHISPTARSNYTPNKAVAMAEQQRNYQNRSAADLATGYNTSLYALAGQRQADINQQAAPASELDNNTLARLILRDPAMGGLNTLPRFFR